MKIPCTINLDLGNNKKIVQDLIDLYGKSKDINQIGMIVNCEAENGMKFQMSQFNSSRNLMHIGAMKPWLSTNQSAVLSVMLCCGPTMLRLFAYALIVKYRTVTLQRT